MPRGDVIWKDETRVTSFAPRCRTFRKAVNIAESRDAVHMRRTNEVEFIKRSLGLYIVCLAITATTDNGKYMHRACMKTKCYETFLIYCSI